MNKIAAFIIIGDEILSGRTKDKNLNFLANELIDLGIDLNEVRVIKDNHQALIATVNELKAKYDYVFTSGGIGPTHDDITSESIAKAFNDQYLINKDAAAILEKYYGKENINDAKLKMAYLPSKAILLDNPVSSAPGFFIENVFVMAGVPKIFRAMFKYAKKNLKTGNIIKSIEIKISLTESKIAKDLAMLQNKYNDVKMGSYPFKNGTSLVFRSTNDLMLENSINTILNLLKKINPNSIIEIIR